MLVMALTDRPRVPTALGQRRRAGFRRQCGRYAQLARQSQRRRPPRLVLSLEASLRFRTRHFGQTGEWSDSGNHAWSAGVVDAALHLGANFELKGEYVHTRYGSDNLGQIDPHGWWAQAGYKLAGLNLELPYINNIELVSRFDCENDGQGTKTGPLYHGLCLLLLKHAALRG